MRDLALRYLNSSHHSVIVLLGYSAISSFTRWFTEDFGKPPAAGRKAGHAWSIEAVTAKAA
jgi:transcriptional regulator GlxA family with amidase domain